MADMEHVRFLIKRDFKEYVNSRKNDVARGAETPVLAALLVHKYGEGLSKALQIIEVSSDLPLSHTINVDEAVLSIDSNAAAHRKRRWEQRPASVSWE